MTGVEYDLGKCLPPRLFIVHKQHRNSPSSGKNILKITNINFLHICSKCYF